ncbi:MAG: hypothetical protein WD468_09570 [Pirellulales bacterium]
MKARFVGITFLVSASFLQVAPLTAKTTVVVGPGPHAPLYVTNADDCHIVDGTQIISPSLTGPPEDFVVPIDAIEFRGGGHIQVDGGYFRGGDASYTVSNGDSATVAGANALHLRQSTGEIFRGSFIGGEAFSATSISNTHGGNGMILVGSDITIYDGYFEGGVETKKRIGPGFTVGQAPAIFAAQGSIVSMYGGEVDGGMRIDTGSSLYIFGRNLQYDGEQLTGIYWNGTPFDHSVLRTGGNVYLMTVVPEPLSPFHVLSVGLVVCTMRRNRLSSLNCDY